MATLLSPIMTFARADGASAPKAILNALRCEFSLWAASPTLRQNPEGNSVGGINNFI